MNPPLPGGSPGRSDLLTVNVTTLYPGLVIIEACGEVDTATSPMLHKELTAVAQSTPDTLVVDLTNIDFFGSSGIKTLMQLHRQCIATGIRLRMVAPKPVHRSLELVGLGSTFILFDTLDKAITG